MEQESLAPSFKREISDEKVFVCECGSRSWEVGNDETLTCSDCRGYVLISDALGLIRTLNS